MIRRPGRSTVSSKRRSGRTHNASENASRCSLFGVEIGASVRSDQKAAHNCWGFCPTGPGRLEPSSTRWRFRDGRSDLDKQPRRDVRQAVFKYVRVQLARPGSGSASSGTSTCGGLHARPAPVRARRTEHRVAAFGGVPARHRALRRPPRPWAGPGHRRPAGRARVALLTDANRKASSPTSRRPTCADAPAFVYSTPRAWTATKVGAMLVAAGLADAGIYVVSSWRSTGWRVSEAIGPTSRTSAWQRRRRTSRSAQGGKAAIIPLAAPDRPGHRSRGRRTPATGSSSAGEHGGWTIATPGWSIVRRIASTCGYRQACGADTLRLREFDHLAALDAGVRQRTARSRQPRLTLHHHAPRPGRERRSTGTPQSSPRSSLRAVDTIEVGRRRAAALGRVAPLAWRSPRPIVHGIIDIVSASGSPTLLCAEADLGRGQVAFLGGPRGRRLRVDLERRSTRPFRVTAGGQERADERIDGTTPAPPE